MSDDTWQELQLATASLRCATERPKTDAERERYRRAYEAHYGVPPPPVGWTPGQAVEVRQRGG